jgi:hypothetical protein
MGTPKGERWGGRAKGTPNMLPDLRAITLKALMKAGGVDYLVRQSEENPMGFMSLLGRVMPRESHVELTGELKVRQEVRRDLVDKVLILMQAPEPHVTTNNGTEGTQRALPAITHTPDTMLKASLTQDREGLSRRAENARREGASMLTGVVQRAAAMHIENDAVESVSGSGDEGISIRNEGPPQRAERGAEASRGAAGVPPRGAPYVRLREPCDVAGDTPNVGRQVEHNAGVDSAEESS